MKKLQSIFVLLLLTLTIFSSFNFIQTASASPPLSGDIAHANASVSYTVISSPTNTGTTNTNIGGSANSTPTALTIIQENFNGWDHPSGTYDFLRASYVWTFSNFTHNGTVDARINGELGGMEGYTASGGYNTGTVWANLTAGGITYTWSYTFNTETAKYVYFAPEWNVSAYTTVTSLNVTISTYSGLYFNGGTPTIGSVDFVNVGVNEISVTSYPNVPLDNWAYGWTWPSSQYSSSFSIPVNTVSYTIDWSASYSTQAEYNSGIETGTSGSYTGSLSVTTIYFEGTSSVPESVGQYTVSYYLAYTTAIGENFVYGEEEYTYTISQNVNFFNSSYIYFNYTLPSGASTSYSASYSLKISNLTLTNPSAPVDSLSLVAPSFTYYSLSKFKSSYNVTAYKNYTSAQNANVKFSTSEIVNYYPTLNYDVVKWSGTGSKAELMINATTIGGGYTFSSESLQILNINWGDSSPLQSSTIQTGQYNWTLYHYYQSTGSFPVSFQVENWIGDANALSTTRVLSYTVSVGITTVPLSNAKINHGESIFFNWSDTSAGMQSIRLSIDSVIQQTNSYSSLLSGSFSFAPTYLGTLTVSWFYVAGNVSGYQNLTYTTSSTISKTGLYVLVNFTLNSQSYSNYYYYSQISPYNLTWSYFTWNIQVPNGSLLSSIKGNNSWLFQSGSPGLYAYYEGNSSIHFYQKSTYYQVVWLAPLPPSFGYFSIKLEDTAGDTIGASGSQFESFSVFVNDRPASSDVVSAETGETYNIKVYSEPYGMLISNSNFTVQYPISEDAIKLPIYPLAVDNANQSYFTLFSVGQNGVTGNITYIAPGQTIDYNIAVGTYQFNFSYFLPSGQLGPHTSHLVTISGPSFQWISGTTLTQISSQVKNVSSQIEDVNISFLNSNSKLQNETLNIEINLKNVNSTIVTQLNNFNITAQDILSIVDHSNTSLSEKILYIDSLINASSYKLIPGSPTLSGDNYSYPIQVIDSKTGLPANLSITEQAARNMQAELVNSVGAIAIPYDVYDIQPGKFYLSLILNASQVDSIQNGGYVSMFGAIGGPISSSVAGKISSSNLPSVTNFDFNSIQGIIGYLGYLEQTTTGRALYLITGLVALGYYITVLTRKKEKKAKRR